MFSDFRDPCVTSSRLLRRAGLEPTKALSRDSQPTRYHTAAQQEQPLVRIFLFLFGFVGTVDVGIGVLLRTILGLLPGDSDLN